MHIKQRILTILAISVMAFTAPVAFAEVKIGVVDVQNAILQSEEAKRLLQQIQDEFKGDQETLLQIRTEGTALAERLGKDGEVMSVPNRRNLERQIQSINADLNYSGTKYQRNIEERQAELFQGINEKVQKAIEEIVLAEDFDLILQRQTALYVGDLYNITRKVTEKLNEQDASAAE